MRGSRSRLGTRAIWEETDRKKIDDKKVVVLILALPVYGVLVVASFNFANHCVFPSDLSQGQNFIPLNALRMSERKCLPQRP